MSCFVADTNVLTSLGVRKITEIKDDDLVYSWSLTYGFCLNPSHGVLTMPSTDVYKIHLTNKLDIFASEDQQFLLDDNTVKFTTTLVEGDTIKTRNKNSNQNCKVMSIEKVSNAVVYNLDVDMNKNFVVCNDDGKIGIVAMAHNS